MKRLPVAVERTCAFAPGRVNLIGEHTDYNQGLALPFAIADGVTVQAEAMPVGGAYTQRLIEAYALDLAEEDCFALAQPPPADGWRAFVRGVVAELAHAGHPTVGARLQIRGEVPLGAGLSSSAALEVALCLALIELGDGTEQLDRLEIATLCSRVENEWAGARTGLLDQLACLYGASDTALCIDFRTLQIDPIPLKLDGWRMVVLDSGERHAHASSGYNERRAECAEACRLLRIDSLREASMEDLELLPEPLQLRAGHVLEENLRVLEAVTALRQQNLPKLGELLYASHTSLRDRYQVSTPAVEATVERLRRTGAAGARMIGGGFGGSVLGLFAPDVPLPSESLEVRPGPGAHLIDD